MRACLYCSDHSESESEEGDGSGEMHFLLGTVAITKLSR